MASFAPRRLFLCEGAKRARVASKQRQGAGRKRGVRRLTRATRLDAWVSREGSVWLRRRRILEKMPSARGRDRDDGVLESFFRVRPGDRRRHTRRSHCPLWPTTFPKRKQIKPPARAETRVHAEALGGLVRRSS